MVGSAAAQTWRVDAELGRSTPVKSDVRIPGRGGTEFSLADLIGRSARTTARLAVTYQTPRGPEYRFLYAPLAVTGTGRLGKTVDFEGRTYNGTDPTTGRFQFNTYRLTWRNQWVKTERRHWRVGATLLVRDAEISLRQGGTFARNYDLGFVPLLHVFGEEFLSDVWTFEFDLDALAAPQGRAIDAGLAFVAKVGPQTSVRLGYRVLDGGADNDKVFNFNQFNTAYVGVTIRF